eukprot:TRINITY_DN16409_c0_g1_i1.p1 TRINITY_DN16409_c0_g1~~TRINITY_DN16409_c0_g1_i1.p1  ORF type:complete len:775 (+),score=189.59 TRINITY_DN16409_c0_g1_i1:112-2436(+)
MCIRDRVSTQSTGGFTQPARSVLAAHRCFSRLLCPLDRGGMKTMPRMILFSLLACAHCVLAQLSNAIAKDSDLAPNAFRDSSPLAVEEVIFGERSTNHSECSVDLRLRWTTEIGSGVYTAPVIADLYADGSKEIVAAGFTRYVEAIDGATGGSTPGWPFVFSKSSFHASPLMYDVDNDGHQEVVLVTNDAEIVFLKQEGVPLYGWTLKVPPLSVRKHWYAGLDEDRTTRRLLSVSTPRNDADYVKAPVEQGAWGGSLSRAGVASLDLLRAPDDEIIEEIKNNKQYPDPLHAEAYQDALKQMMAEAAADQSDEYVLVDAHIMATPVIADLDGDGRPELVATVSYYYDREEVDNPTMHPPLPDDVIKSKYVAGGVVVFQMDDQSIKWSQHLDLTTDTTKLRAYIYTSPTVADLDGDGRLDVIVGTSVGFIYVLDDTGRVFSGFPIQIGEIQGSIAVEDVTGDGSLDLIVADASGNVLCVSNKGAIQWERKISGFSSQGASIGDVDGNNKLDVVVGTTTGHVWALEGNTGAPLEGFPVKTEGKIIAPVLLTQIKKPTAEHGNNGGVMQLIVPSFDGGLYIFDGKGPCVHRVDIGESAYSMVLADDVTGDGKLDLVVGTIAGNLFVFGTSMPFDPSLTWASQGQVSKMWQGVKVQQSSRTHRDVLGRSFVVQFEIVDRSTVGEGSRRYNVSISVGGTTVLSSKSFTSTGMYTEVVQSPEHRGAAAVIVRMQNQHGQVFEDSMSLSFNVHFYKMLKWMLFLPFAATAVLTMVIVRPSAE